METSNSLLDADIIREQKPVWAFSRKVFCEGIRAILPSLSRWALQPARRVLPRFRGFWPVC